MVQNSLLEEKIRLLKEEDEEMCVKYKIYDKEEGSALIIAIITPYIVYKMVRDLKQIF